MPPPSLSSTAVPLPTGAGRRNKVPGDRVPVQRLHSINSGTPPRFISTSPAPRNRNVCPYCGSTRLIEDKGSLYCNDCARTVSEANPYVNEQQFAENVAGASQPVGQYIAADQTHARTSGPMMPGGRAGPRIKGEGLDNGARTRNHAKARIQSFATQLRLRDTRVGIAVNFFTLAQHNNFLTGRTIDAVAACSLYIACRKREHPASDPLNADTSDQVMLIDFAEILDMNVFLLGATYTKMVEVIWGTRNGTIDSTNSFQLQPFTPETLVSRFVEGLEFEKKHWRKIKQDAVDVIRRMKRDWMTHGRRPAGICGAAVILAARMNNYRRTVREVVLVAKVTEVTINKRLEEFMYTESSSLTVDNFRDEGIRNALKETDPPAYYKALGLGPEKKKRKRGRPRKNPLPETATELEGDDDDGDGGRPEKRARFDQDGFRIPAVPGRGVSEMPIDPQLQEQGVTAQQMQPQTEEETEEANQGEDYGGPKTRSRGRPKGSRNRVLRPPTQRELTFEAELEGDMRYGLAAGQEALGGAIDDDDEDDRETSTATTAVAGTSATPQPQRDSDDRENDPSAPVTSAWKATRTPGGPAVNTNVGNTGTSCSMETEIDKTEFDDDPDVAFCQLSEAEKDIKERIWVTENAEWIQKNSDKQIAKARKEARAAARGETEGAGGKKGRRKKKAGRVGDISYMDQQERQDGDGASEDGNRSRRSATEAMEMMLAARAPSRRVNYNILEGIYGPRSSTRSSSVVSDLPERGRGTQSPAPPILDVAASPSPGLRSSARSTPTSAPLPTPTLAAAPTRLVPGATANNDEVVGSVDDDDESSALSSAQSPMLGVSRHGFGAGGEEDDDDDESEGSEDDYVRDDDEELAAAFEGRTRSSRVRRDS